MFFRAGELKRYVPAKAGNNECVILVHGLFMTGFILSPIARKLVADGYVCSLYDYPTIRFSVAEHGAALAEHVRKIRAENSFSRIHFVTHSMGGLLIRSLLGQLLEEERTQIGRIVMIAPPNKGSDVAAFFLRLLPFAPRLVRCLPDLSSSPDSYANTAPGPKDCFEIGIIGGTRDFEVKQHSTHLAGERDHILFSCGHTSILFTKNAAAQTLFFLRNGCFHR